MVEVDIFTKFAHFIPVKRPYTTASIAQLSLDNIVKLHGLPKTIVSNKDTIFVSAFQKEPYIQSLQSQLSNEHCLPSSNEWAN